VVFLTFNAELMDAHGRASTGTGCACLAAIFWVLVGLAWHGRASDSGQGGQKISPFSHHIRTKTYKTNKNNTKQRKIKQLNPWVASHEALF